MNLFYYLFQWWIINNTNNKKPLLYILTQMSFCVFICNKFKVIYHSVNFPISKTTEGYMAVVNYTPQCKA